MRVTLVADALGPELTGIGRYTWELCRHLPLEPALRQVSFFAGGRLVKDPRRLLDRSQPAPARRGPARQLARWSATRRLRSTLVHGPNYFLPEEAETGIITVHDLSVFRFPESHPVERLRHFEREFMSSLQRARHVITDTETVRREVLADFALPDDRVTSVALGVDARYRASTSDALRPKLAVWGLEPGGYALCVSTLEPRKRIAELLQAWRALPRSVRDRTPLVLVGASGWLNAELHEQIRDGVAEGWLKHLGFVGEPDLPALYAGSALFLYPSIYEGFGLPPVEAMACGIPVLVANRSCLPEVCGDAAGYVDPDDIDAFRDAVVHALSDDEWRATARSKGLEKSATYSWKRCSEQTAAVYLANAPR